MRALKFGRAALSAAGCMAGLLGFSGTAFGQAAITAAANANLLTCAAPCAVHFDATGTTYEGQPVEEKYLALDYRWNFGDSESGTWAEGARARGGVPQSKNVEYGFVAAHVYERPGTYSVTLTVTNGTASDQLDSPLRINVVSGDTQWPGTSTICVSSSSLPVAGSGGCPTGAAVFRESDFNVAVDTRCNIDTAPVRCLLKGGDTFTGPRISNIANTGPSMLGTYGGGKATINATTNSLIRLGDGQVGFRLVDMRIIGDPTQIASSNGAVYIYTWEGDLVSKFLSLRVDIENFDQTYYFRGDYPGYTPPTVHMNSEFAIVDGTVLHGAGHGGNDMFMMGNKMAILGMRVADKRLPPNTTETGEHVVRSKYLRKSIYAHSAFGLLDASNPANYGCLPHPITGTQGNTILKIVAGFSMDMPNPEDGYTQENIVSDNYISHCRNNTWDVTISPTDGGVQKSPEHLRYMVVEGNHFTAIRNERQVSGSGKFIHVANTSHIAIRNNVFDATATPLSMISLRGVAIATNPDQLGAPGYVPARDVRILNNTMYQNTRTTNGRILADIAATDVTRIQVANNLLYSVEPAANVLTVSSASAAATQCCGGSTCPGSCNVDLTSSPFAGAISANSRLSEFALRAGVSPVNTGVPQTAMVTRDALGGCRSGSWDIGAVELGASRCVEPALTPASAPPAPPSTLTVQ